MMQISIEFLHGRWNGTGRAGIALVGAGSLTIGIFELGTLTTLVVAFLTIVVGFGGLRLWSAVWRGRQSESPSGDCRLTAPATFGERTGVLTITSSAVRWSGEDTETHHAEREIEKAEIRPLPLVGAAELRLVTTSGSDVLFTVTAPARTIQRALSDE